MAVEYTQNLKPESDMAVTNKENPPDYQSTFFSETVIFSYLKKNLNTVI